jgi:hypothetical protein
MNHYLQALSTLVLLLIATASYGQTTTVTGTVVDTSGNALVAASAVLLETADSTLVGFGLTNDDGFFKIGNIKAGQYVAQITYVGYGTVGKLVDIAATDKKEDLGQIIMYTADNQLAEVTVKASFIPIVVKKDTIEYSADAFKVKPNATVEDLLKQLPGIEVEDDGSIKAQGEDVTRVTVDGKTFFGDDPKMATRNLPAEAVDKVQVIDRKSDKAQFTGVDDGERVKEVNLELKEDHKQGLFGDVTAGIGQDQNNYRYESKFNLNRFTDNWQISALGSYNNINQEFFGLNDMYGIRRGGNQVSPGITSTLGAGVNAVYTKGQEIELSTSYFASSADTRLTRLSDSEIFRNDGTFSTLTDEASQSDVLNHSVEVELEWTPDTINRFEVETSLEFGLGDFTQAESASNKLSTRSISELSQDEVGNTQTFDLDVELEYTRKLKKAGRSISAQLDLGRSSELDELLLDQSNILLDDPTGPGTFSILQDQIADLDNDSYLARVSYTEPLSDRLYLDIIAKRSNRNSTSIRDFFDLDPNDQTIRNLNEALSATFDNAYQYTWGGLQLQRNYDKVKVTAGVDYKLSQISGVVANGASVSNDFRFVLPRLILNWDKARVRVSYSTSVREPSTTQLSPILDNTDPNNLYQGNPDLRPEYTHTVNARWYFWDSFTFRNFFVNTSMRYTLDNIVTAREISPSLVRTSRPINVEDQVTGSMSLSYGQPINPLRVKARASLGYSYTNGLNFINGRESEVTTTAPTLRLQVENLDNEVLSVRLSSRFRWNTNSYSLTELNDQRLLSQRYQADVILDFGKGWTLDQEVNYNIFTQENQSSSESFVLWNATLQKSLMNDRLAIRLRGFDLLGQNQAIIQSTTTDSVTESISNTLTSYGMISVMYKLSDFNPQRGFRVFRMD